MRTRELITIHLRENLLSQAYGKQSLIQYAIASLAVTDNFYFINPIRIMNFIMRCVNEGFSTRRSES